MTLVELCALVKDERRRWLPSEDHEKLTHESSNGRVVSKWSILTSVIPINYLPRQQQHEHRKVQLQNGGGQCLRHAGSSSRKFNKP